MSKEKEIDHIHEENAYQTWSKCMLKQLDYLELESPHRQNALIEVAYGIIVKISDAMHDKRRPLAESLFSDNFIDTLLDIARHFSILKKAPNPNYQH
ncbi:MAG: hypothetical protein WAJ93_14905 [Candidatus Nitrosopolaris sp.]